MSALAVWVLMALLVTTPLWKRVEYALYDQMMVASAAGKSRFPITLVGIDEPSFAALGLQWPWPRSLHAELVDRLTAAGAAMVVFDVVFSEPSTDAEDQAFADAIFNSGNVVLAADRVYHESANVRQWVRLDPLQTFTGAGAVTGLATVTLDPDLEIREIPLSKDALWRQVVLRLMRSHPEVSPNLALPSGALIRYAGGIHTFPFVPYHEVIQPSGAYPPDFFKDQIVIVGRDVKAAPDVGSAQADLFATPFAASTGWLMPGAEVHANIIETVLGNRAIAPAQPWLVQAMLVLMAAATTLLMRRWRPLQSALYGVALCAAVLAAGWVLFVYGDYWLPTASSLTVVPLLYVGLGGWSYFTERQRRQEITRMFSLYVTPQVVDYLIAHPERINLGGERRNVTLLFTDLAGFTTFSEILTPENVTGLLNRHFTLMTDIVLHYEGTVVQFIGDAIMAFWGAPLEDEDQAWHAVATAVAMQRTMEALRAELEKEGLPQIRMRIGVHSGSVVVGNLGSAKRFGYTAVGDDVNLAARLEGINKLYHTGIMVSAETVQQVGERIAFRPVDRVIVKGRKHAVEVFTPCEDAELIEQTRNAITAFRAQDWDASQARWQAILEKLPDDGIAQLYLERIAAFRAAPPEAGWDGAVALEKL